MINTTYDGSSIHASVINTATIRIVLTLMLMGNMAAEVVDVKGAFLKRDIDRDGTHVDFFRDSMYGREFT